MYNIILSTILQGLQNAGDTVTITCYRDKEKMTRKDAVEKYLDCMANSEGAEHERYESIFLQLLGGSTTPSDMKDWRE